MIKKPTVNRYISLLLPLIMIIFCGSIIHVNGSVDNIEASPIQLYLVANPDTLYQRDHFNMSLSITNVHYEEIPNITIRITIPNELEFLDSSVLDLNVEENANELTYNLGSLNLDENVLFTIVYNVTSPNTKNPLTLAGANVSYQLINGISSFQISNTVAVFLKGEQVVTDTSTLPQLPESKEEAPDLLVIITYILPIVVFSFSVVILRRFRR